MSEKTEVQNAIFESLVDKNAVVLRVNGGTRANIPFYFWRARYHVEYDVLPEILQSAYDYCDDLRWRLARRPRILKNGIADLLGTLSWGQAFYIECKAPGELGKWSSQEQALFLLEQHARGAAVGVFDDPAQFEAWYAEMEAKR